MSQGTNVPILDQQLVWWASLMQVTILDFSIVHSNILLQTCLYWECLLYKQIPGKSKFPITMVTREAINLAPSYSWAKGWHVDPNLLYFSSGFQAMQLQILSAGDRAHQWAQRHVYVWAAVRRAVGRGCWSAWTGPCFIWPRPTSLEFSVIFL